jgi:phage recombination protein Bet
MRGQQGRPTTEQVLSGNSAAMVRANDDPAPMVITPRAFTDDQKTLILDVFAGGASQDEAEILWLTAKNLGLDPLKKQVHFVKQWDGTRDREVWSVRVGIDGFRAKAEETGLYDGQDEPEYEHDKDGKLVLARVRVYRKDMSRPAVGVARWAEYVQTKRDGTPNAMWRKMPYNMLAKCAEALALRKAFPEKLSGVYTEDEMGQTANVAPPSPPPPMPERKMAVDPDAIAERVMGAIEQATNSGNAKQARADLALWLRDNGVPRDPTGASALAEFDRRTAKDAPAVTDQPSAGDVA